MRKLKVYYSDKLMSDRERFSTEPYEPTVAREVADVLATMGCTNFEFVPEKRRQA